VGRLLKHCDANGWPIGLIINLSVQEGLYASEVPSDLPTCHVPLESKSLPSDEDVATVIRHAAKFWKEHPDGYIAIHCAYGATINLMNRLQHPTTMLASKVRVHFFPYQPQFTKYSDPFL
jgi:hypothetical protein